MAKSQILCDPNSNKYLGFGHKGLGFCRNNGRLNENLERDSQYVPKWVLINRPKIRQMPRKLSAQKFGILMKKGSIGCPKSVLRRIQIKTTMSQSLNVKEITVLFNFKIFFEIIFIRIAQRFKSVFQIIR